MDSNLFGLIPNAEPEEISYLETVVKDLNEEQLKNFSLMYSSKRKDPQTILITTLLGFIGISGVQRFLLEQTGMGVLYLFTGGLCAIGTIIDIVNYKSMTFDYNKNQAMKLLPLVKSK